MSDVIPMERIENWRSQFVTSKSDKIGLRHPPMAFTEQGVAMLSSVLQSKRAFQVNIEVMRAFVRLREILSTQKDLKRKLLQVVFDQKTGSEKYMLSNFKGRPCLSYMSF